MIFIDEIKENITSKIDEIGVLRKNRVDNILSIEEVSSGLNKVSILNLPNENIWIFENEFDQLQSIENQLIADQKGAFECRGQKPEKTIFYFNNGYLYVIMIELKETMNPNNFSNSIDKFTIGLNFMSIFLAATNLILLSDKKVSIYPIGLCCYNHSSDGVGYTEKKKYQNNDKKSKKKSAFLEKYIEQGHKEFHIKIEPIILGQRLDIPILFFENPNQNPITTEFSINFNDILTRALAI
jgi:hypothetical protein